MNLLQELIVMVRAARKEIEVPEKEFAPIRVSAADPEQSNIASKNANILAKMARVATVEIVRQTLTGPGTRSTAAFDVQVIYERTIDVPAERERLTKDLAKFNKGLEAAEKQLSNEGFLARAPEHIVAGLKKQQAETLALKEKAEAALAALPQA
jgi:valyl-tRNA synthetase